MTLKFTKAIYLPFFCPSGTIGLTGAIETDGVTIAGLLQGVTLVIPGLACSTVLIVFPPLKTSRV